MAPIITWPLAPGAGEGLLLRAVEETRRRAFALWEQRPWMPCAEAPPMT